ncbi:hypothetical protein BaRGS_00027790 [Batillaria attramentaria]|uniref:Lactate/malate dehydrogenase C-terminal domain-containing protein n=1 Tax=Batillaria attramentaria TaxID=370345 RepID=A0ABD0K1Y4_9CAEN
MAKVVIAGRSDCPYFSKVELLGDRLVKNLPSFQLHKIVKTPEEWENWVSQTCKDRGWDHKTSPLIWRELIDRGGKGVLIGGASDFQEYVNGYYGLESELKSQDMRFIAEENAKTKQEVDAEEAHFRSLSKPLHICLSGASSPTCYALISSITSGEVFGKNTELNIRLLETPLADTMAVSAVAMETQDLCCGLVRGIEVCDFCLDFSFKDCSVIVLMDEVLQGAEEDYDSWIHRNCEFFTSYAKVINDVAKRNVRVLVTGSGPINFNAMMMIKNAPNINRQSIVAMSRCVENRAKSVIAQRLNVNSAGVVDLIVWGSVNGKHFIDARVHGYDGAIWGPPWYSLSAVEMIHDNKWLEKEYLEEVENRKTAVETALGHAASASSARAISTMLTHWWNGSPLGQMFSLGVCSEGLYGVPEGLVFSYPVTLSPSGYWTVVQDMNLTPETFEKLKETIQDLKTELEVIYPPPYVPPPTPPEEPEEEEPPVEEPPAEEQPSEAPSAMTLPGESSGADKDQDDENQEDHPDADAENEEAENEEAENEAEDD